MAGQLSLPTEILVKIFQNLSYIDDVDNLRRTCRRLSSVLDDTKDPTGQTNETFYISIVRAIITKSPIHRHDVRLCKIMDLHQQFVKHYTSGGAPFTPQDAYPFLSAPNIEMSLRECLEVHPDDITDSRIRDIIARWKGLGELQKPYLSKNFEPAEHNYLNPWNLKAGTDRYAISRLNELICPPSDAVQEQVRQPWEHHLDQDQQERFYVALTCYWLLNEYRWCLSHIGYQHLGSQQGHVKDYFNKMLKKDEERYGRRTLLDELDLLEIFEFISHHLLPKSSRIFESIRAPHSLQMEGGWRAADWERWRTLLRDASALLQLPDLIEIVAWSNAQSDRQDFRDPWYPTFLQSALPCKTHAPGDLVTSSLGYPGHNDNLVGDLHYVYLRRRVFTAIEMRCNPNLIIEEQEEEFEKYWADHVRGRVFWWAQSEPKAIARIDRWKERVIKQKMGIICCW